MKSYDSFMPTDFQIGAASLRILNEGNWMHKEHFNEMVDQWIEETNECNYQQYLDEVAA
jgi:hypothetical protein